MRREQRNKKKNSTNTLIYISGGVLAAAIIAFIITFVVYSNRLNSNSSGILDTQFLSDMGSNNVLKENTTSASSSMGKTVEESENELNNTSVVEKSTSSTENNVSNEKTEKNNETVTENKSKSKKSTKEEKDPSFVSPIESSDILREYAKENLVYSETLKEWITHLGIDIKAEKATVVKAAADGTVKAIKNDPRYGLTIIIEHSNRYKTLYANLLTTEFVSEGEKVKAGQTIGTVGDTAVYEVVDEPHLHFELIKNNENINPNELIKF